jgi:transcriptional regulator with XRE-family HTH domain
LTTISKLGEKLRDPEYRKAFVASQINIGLPFQLRALLKARGRTQEWLAEKTGMLQPRISGLLNPGKTRPNIETLRRLADAFDCGLAVRFVPFSELAGWSEAFDPESFIVPSFENDYGFVERNGFGLSETALSATKQYTNFEPATLAPEQLILPDINPSHSKTELISQAAQQPVPGSQVIPAVNPSDYDKVAA